MSSSSSKDSGSLGGLDPFRRMHVFNIRARLLSIKAGAAFLSDRELRSTFLSDRKAAPGIIRRIRKL
jgi:hypothetical protein